MKNRIVNFSFLLLALALLMSNPLQAKSEGCACPHAIQSSVVMDILAEAASGPNGQVLLIPRMMEAERVALTAKAIGTVVYQIDGKIGYWIYDGKAWTTASTLESSTWKVAAVDETGWNLVNEKGEKQKMTAAAGYRAESLRSATDLTYTFKSWTQLYENRQAMNIARLKSMFAGIEQLDFQGQNVHVVFAGNTKASEITEFFKMLGYNTIEPIN